VLFRSHLAEHGERGPVELLREGPRGPRGIDRERALREDRAGVVRVVEDVRGDARRSEERRVGEECKSRGVAVT